jgi:hypothetical protein
MEHNLRIKSLLSTQRKTAVELAAFCDVTYQAAYLWSRGKVTPRERLIPRIADFFNMTEREFRYGDTPVFSFAAIDDENAMTIIKTMVISGDATEEIIAVKMETVSDTFPVYLPNSWLRENYYFAENLIVMRAIDDSMKLAIHEGDRVVINSGDKTIIDGKVFLVLYEGKPMIRRFQRNRGKWWLHADDDFSAWAKEVDENTLIVGKVILVLSEKI